MAELAYQILICGFHHGGVFFVAIQSVRSAEISKHDLVQLKMNCSLVICYQMYPNVRFQTHQKQLDDKIVRLWALLHGTGLDQLGWGKVPPLGSKDGMILRCTVPRFVMITCEITKKMDILKGKDDLELRTSHTICFLFGSDWLFSAR